MIDQLLDEAEELLYAAHVDYAANPELYTVRGEVLSDLVEIADGLDTSDYAAVRAFRDAVHYLVG